MNLFELAQENEVAISRIGMRALEEAQHAGVPVCYMEPAYGTAIIREYPDGRRERIVDERTGASVPIPPRG